MKMPTITKHTSVTGESRKEITLERRTKRVFLLFTVEWWENVKTTHIGNDIHIHTDHEIGYVYLNGKLIRSLTETV